MVGVFFFFWGICMDYKYIGILEPTIAEYWGISEHKNKPILVYNDRKQHVIDHHLMILEV